MTDEYPPELRRIIARIEPGWPEDIHVGPGWYALLGRLDEQLSAADPRYTVQQVKSKFGALSFYARASEEPSEYNNEFHEIVRAAEWASTETCEECSAPAQTYTIRMWVWTLCTEHAKIKRKCAEDD